MNDVDPEVGEISLRFWRLPRRLLLQRAWRSRACILRVDPQEAWGPNTRGRRSRPDPTLPYAAAHLLYIGVSRGGRAGGSEESDCHRCA